MTLTELECCNKTLELLLKNVKNLEDLDLIEATIEDYQVRFKVDLIKYKREIRNMRAEYLERETGR